MTEYDNNNRGAIWGNKDRKTDKHPDFKGEAMIDGKEYWVAAWKRKENASPKAPSLNFKFELKDDARDVG